MTERDKEVLDVVMPVVAAQGVVIVAMFVGTLVVNGRILWVVLLGWLL